MKRFILVLINIFINIIMIKIKRGRRSVSPLHDADDLRALEHLTIIRSSLFPDTESVTILVLWYPHPISHCASRDSGRLSPFLHMPALCSGNDESDAATAAGGRGSLVKVGMHDDGQ
jgi:hypothetical protein